MPSRCSTLAACAAGLDELRKKGVPLRGGLR